MKWKLVLRDDAEADNVLFDLLTNFSNSTQGNLKKIILFLMFDIKIEIKGKICYFYCCISRQIHFKIGNKHLLFNMEKMESPLPGER